MGETQMPIPVDGKYVFSTASGLVDLFFRTGAGLGDPGAGGNAFDLEIFTIINPETSDPGFEGSVFAPGGTLDPSGSITTTIPSLTLNDGDFWVTDLGGSDTITAGSGNQTITGGSLTTIIGGTGNLAVKAGD